MGVCDSLVRPFEASARPQSSPLDPAGRSHMSPLPDSEPAIDHRVGLDDEPSFPESCVASPLGVVETVQQREAAIEVHRERQLATGGGIALTAKAEIEKRGLDRSFQLSDYSQRQVAEVA